MQFRTIGLLLLGAMALPAAGTAQTTPAPPAITRTVIAATKLPTVTDVPLHFKAVSITLQPDALHPPMRPHSHKSNFRGAAHPDAGFNHLCECADFVFPATIRASHCQQCILI